MEMDFFGSGNCCGNLRARRILRKYFKVWNFFVGNIERDIFTKFRGCDGF